MNLGTPIALSGAGEDLWQIIRLARSWLLGSIHLREASPVKIPGAPAVLTPDACIRTFIDH